MIRAAVLAGLLLGTFVAGMVAMFYAVDRLFGGSGPVVTLSPAHRRALDLPPPDAEASAVSRETGGVP